MSTPEPKPRQKQGEKKPDGNKDAFDALLRRAVPDEATPPEDETSDPASS